MLQHRSLLALFLVGCAPFGGPLLDGGDAADGGDTSSDGAATGSDGGAGDGSTSSSASAPTRYLPGALHSPYSPSVIARLDAVVAASTGRHDVFSKIGDSITADGNFLDCMNGSHVDLGAYAALEPTRAWFDKTVVDGAGHTSFDRTSLCATVGWTAGKALLGSPTPLQQEVDAVHPGFAVVMYGTNDTDPTYPAYIDTFERNLVTIVDDLLADGVVPLVSTIPPRGDSAAANALVPEMNAAIRAVAQARQVPYMDLWQTLEPLPLYGLSPDGVHPQAYVSGGARGCWFTPDALVKGMNQRNLLVLTSLDRARRFLVEGAPAEAAPPALVGDGSWSAPLAIDALPFVDAGDTSRSATRTADVYSCGAQDESGPEVVYQITLAAPTKLRARVFVDSGVDVDLQWLDAARPDRCLARADKSFDVDAGPGTYWLSLDSYVSGGKALAGAYRLTVVALPPQ